MIKKWHNVPGEFTQEFAFYDGAFRLPCGMAIDVEGDTCLQLIGPSDRALLLADSEEGEPFEFVVSFNSSGYDDPGRVSGPPEDCYPPDRDDERLQDNVKVVWKGVSGESREILLAELQAQEVFDYFMTEIDEVELDEDYDVGDY